MYIKLRYIINSRINVDIKSIQLSTHKSRKLAITRGNTRLNVSHGLLVVPDNFDGDEVKIGVERLFATPLYWSLSDLYLGDKILSYNGYLRFAITSNSRKAFNGQEDASKYPLVQLRGNYK